LTDNFVVYKFKTTAPKKYSVKPKEGIISPLEIDVIEVTLNSTNDMNNDKLRVEVIRVSSGLMDKDQNHNVSELVKTKNNQVFKNIRIETQTFDEKGCGLFAHGSA
jgi:CRISPR/Cas system CMR-associated protein Cmr3 (group 5 of RAMP superfamily)